MRAIYRLKRSHECELSSACCLMRARESLARTVEEYRRQLQAQAKLAWPDQLLGFLSRINLEGCNKCCARL